MTEANSPHAKKAYDLFVSGYGCAQSVLVAFSDVVGLDPETLKKLGAPFGGGMGRMREICGACTAMFAVAGLLYGDYDPTDNKAKSEHYALIQNLAGQFKQKHETINCLELLKGLNVTSDPNSTPRTKEFYKVRPCVKFVITAAEILDRLIEEKK